MTSHMRQPLGSQQKISKLKKKYLCKHVVVNMCIMIPEFIFIVVIFNPTKESMVNPDGN